MKKNWSRLGCVKLLVLLGVIVCTLPLQTTQGKYVMAQTVGEFTLNLDMSALSQPAGAPASQPAEATEPAAPLEEGTGTQMVQNATEIPPDAFAQEATEFVDEDETEQLEATGALNAPVNLEGDQEEASNAAKAPEMAEIPDGGEALDTTQSSDTMEADQGTVSSVVEPSGEKSQGTVAEQVLGN